MDVLEPVEDDDLEGGKLLEPVAVFDDDLLIVADPVSVELAVEVRLGAGEAVLIFEGRVVKVAIDVPVEVLVESAVSVGRLDGLGDTDTTAVRDEERDGTAEYVINADLVDVFDAIAD